MILTSANFMITPYVIANQANTAGAVDPVILAQEKEMLIDLLGYVFYNALKIGLEDLPGAWSATTDYAVDAEVLSGGVIYKSLQTPNLNKAVTEVAYWEAQEPTKWLKLKTGAEYEHLGYTRKWSGLVELLKPGVFSRYLEKFVISQTGVGTTVPKSENADVVSPASQICSAWNDYNKLASGALYLNSEVDTLYGYLIANASEFDEDVTGKGYDDFLHYLSLNFCPPDNMNVFDL